MTTPTPDTSDTTTARNGLTELIADVVAASTPDAVTTTSDGRREPLPLHALAAARLIERCARVAARTYAARARAAGHSWYVIADGAGITPADEPYERAYTAFLRVADTTPRPWGVSVGWTCPACHCPIRDYGPEIGHPDDAEVGHHPQCPRRLADLATHEQDTADDD